MRSIHVAAGIVAGALALSPTPAHPGISFQTVTPDTPRDFIAVTVEEVTDTDSKFREHETPLPEWEEPVYRFTVSCQVPSAKPGQVGASARLVLGGKLLATTRLEPRWEGDQFTTEVTVSEVLARKSELNVYRGYDGPAARVFILPLESYLSANE